MTLVIVTSIGEGMFQYCTGLTSVTIQCQIESRKLSASLLTIQCSWLDLNPTYCRQAAKQWTNLEIHSHRETLLGSFCYAYPQQASLLAVLAQEDFGHTPAWLSPWQSSAAWYPVLLWKFDWDYNFHKLWLLFILMCTIIQQARLKRTGITSSKFCLAASLIC